MPIEIRELVIKTSVSGGGQSSNVSASSDRPSAGDSAAIVAECVDQVLSILKDKVER
ncbi:MAG: DUF5908 family protein [Cyanobacteria bacterium P01_F01_bin.150]